MSFLFFRLCCVYCFHENETCNCMFFWFGKHYGNCYLLNIKELYRFCLCVCIM
ncbi:hypothetical protein Hdeb2414_s0013g00408111 [Helianthus debilis subsp. tardiflorus]